MKRFSFAFLAICWVYLMNDHSVSCQLLNLLDKAKTIGEDTVAGVATPVEKVVVATTLKKCDAFKAIFGVSFDALLGTKDEPDASKLSLDLCTKSKKTRLNITVAAEKLLQNPDFDVNKPLVIFLHGFLASADGEGAQTVTKSLVARGNMNVLALDSSGLLSYFYLQSATCVRFIGRALALMFVGLVEGGMDPAKIHVVGHSLGAHMAGFCGKTFQEKTGKTLGHITGLDPAGPCFFQEKTDLKLKESDADFVDIIHTDAGILGLTDAIGHVDFYPNGGEKQPACVVPPCSHSRAWAIYSASVDAEDRFPAVKCVSWDTFLSDSCNNNKKANMGYGVDKETRGTYYLKTTGKPPYGLGGPKPEATTKKGLLRWL